MDFLWFSMDLHFPMDFQRVFQRLYLWSARLRAQRQRLELCRRLRRNAHWGARRWDGNGSSSGSWRDYIWLVVTGTCLNYFPIPLGMSSSQLTNSYFSEGWLNHQPDMVSENDVGAMDNLWIISIYIYILSCGYSNAINYPNFWWWTYHP